MGAFLLLWSTQMLSQLGSEMTSFALTLWLFERTGSALQMSALSVCSYAPYVLLSIFAGALTDRWDKKKTMLISDAFTAFCAVAILLLYSNGKLEPWHLYGLNIFNGLMNTVQNPASEVAITLLTPKDKIQQASSFKSLSGSLITVFHPIIATALYGFGGMDLVLIVDLATFSIAFLSLLFFIHVPECSKESGVKVSVLQEVRYGLQFLKGTPMVLWLILFLAGVNLVASAFDAALPAYILPRPNGGNQILGLVSSCAGAAMLAGNLANFVLPTPTDRIRVIVYTMLFSLTTDNFLMSLTDSPFLWCVAQVLGYVPVTLMNTNLDVVVRSSIPTEMQGRVYACRNTLQFFTIPLGRLLGGLLIDETCDPLMASVQEDSLLVKMFSKEGGSGAALMIFLLGIAGLVICLVFERILRPYNFEEKEKAEVI